MALLESPAKLPDPRDFAHRGALCQGAHHVAGRYIGPIVTRATERRGVYKNMTYLDTARVEFDFEFPLAEIILDFFDKLKTISRVREARLRYARVSASDLVKLEMLINGDPWTRSR